MVAHEITTGHGIYRIKVPTGRGAARHFSLLRRASPKKVDEDGKPIITEDDDDTAQKCFEIWSEMVLPKIIEEFPEGILNYDEMPGEDMFTIWNAMFDLAQVGCADGALFHIDGQ